MTRTLGVFTVLAGLHLVLVLGGALKKPLLPREHVATPALRTYGAISGSDSNYGFFAPAVGPQFRGLFLLTDVHGNTWTATMTEGLNPEASLRAGCNAAIFGMPEVSDETRKGLLASWAAFMLSKHSSAVNVTIRVEVFDPPSMDEIQNGKAAEWRLIDTFGPYNR